MILLSFVVALHLIWVHGPDKQEIGVNTSEISSIREPKDTEQHYPPAANCILYMSNGKFIPVIELIKEADKEG